MSPKGCPPSHPKPQARHVFVDKQVSDNALPIACHLFARENPDRSMSTFCCLMPECCNCICEQKMPLVDKAVTCQDSFVDRMSMKFAEVVHLVDAKDPDSGLTLTEMVMKIERNDKPGVKLFMSFGAANCGQGAVFVHHPSVENEAMVKANSLLAHLHHTCGHEVEHFFQPSVMQNNPDSKWDDKNNCGVSPQMQNMEATLETDRCNFEMLEKIRVN